MHIILSPHLDDAAFSCGGLIHHLKAAGEAVAVINLFAGIPPAHGPLSPLASALHERMHGVEGVVEVRRREDEEALQLLGVRPVHLDFYDCIYRGIPAQEAWYYPSLEAVFGRVHPDEAGLPDQLLPHVRGFDTGPGVRWYAPLGVGGHVDHQHAFEVARRLSEQGEDIWYYEDFPYADTSVPHPLVSTMPHTLEARIRLLGGSSRTITLAPDALTKHVAAASCYASQLDMMFGSAAEMQRRMVRFFRPSAAANPALRLWQRRVSGNQ